MSGFTHLDVHVRQLSGMDSSQLVWKDRRQKHKLETKEEEISNRRSSRAKKRHQVVDVCRAEQEALYQKRCLGCRSQLSRRAVEAGLH